MTPLPTNEQARNRPYLFVEWQQRLALSSPPKTRMDMNAANPEFFQVWQQVRHWPLELRQNLAVQINNSVDSDLLAANGGWDEAKNARRCDLIDKDIQGTLDDAEQLELERLTRALRLHRRQVAPIPGSR